MMKIKKIAVLTLIFLMAALPALSAPPSPREQVQEAVDNVMATLADQTLTSEARDQRLEELVRSQFDFQLMGQWILGVHWRQATPEQRERFIELFTQLLETTYRDRMSEYADQYAGDEQVEIVSERIIDNRALVDTIVITADRKRIPISYKLDLQQGEWRAYDVVIEEVSLVNTYRSEYAELVRRHGFDGLFSRMEKRIAELRAR
jgi:phospholipid transport system substrate-binding protein